MFRKIKLELAQAQSSDRITARAHCARCARENRWRIGPEHGPRAVYANPDADALLPQDCKHAWVAQATKATCPDMKLTVAHGGPAKPRQLQEEGSVRRRCDPRRLAF